MKCKHPLPFQTGYLAQHLNRSIKIFEISGSHGSKYEVQRSQKTLHFKLLIRRIYRLERPVFDLRQRQRIFPPASLCIHRPPVQRVLEVLYPGVKHSQGITLTTHPHPEPRSKLRSYTSFPPLHLHGIAVHLYS
jgi:hypothetical protein